MAKKKLLTTDEYRKLCKEYQKDIESEEYSDEQVWDLAKCVIESGDEESEKIVAYLKSIGVQDLIGRFADDI